MMNRAERRRLKQKFYNRKLKLLFQKDHGYRMIPCEANEIPVNGINCMINHHYRKDAESWKEMKQKSDWVYLFKNTRTIYSSGYWNKYERHWQHKQSRKNAKLDIKNGIETAFERINLG